MSFQDNGDKEKVQAATDLVRLVGEQVNLKPKGKEFAGLCPFHDDKTPSMQVSPQKQIYKCFSCGAGGDAFSFVMNYHKMTFPEAMKYLADRAGIELTPWKPAHGGAGQGEQQGPSERKRIAAANEQAVGFFRAMLKHPEHGSEARAYLDRRGVSAEMIEVFQLGYAPDKWDGLVQMIQHKGWDAEAFVLGGLLKRRKNDPNPEPRNPNPGYDFLRHRLVFPIFDAIGRPIAFGGRKLRDEDEPKYLNSPETPLFNKSATLYGLHAAKKPIIDSKTAVIVEGYTDVIACHQAGARNVVAALGTALTAEHVRELRRYCEQVILVMDGDAAGQKAADRAIEVFLTQDLDVSMAVLPGGQDPDELLKAGGLEAWDAVLSSAQDALSFQFDRVSARLNQADTITGRQRVAEDYMNQLVELGITRVGAVRRSFIISRLAQLLHMSASQVDLALKDRTPRSSRSLQSPGPAADSEPLPSTENTENNVSLDVAASHSRSKLKPVATAEKRLIAALVRHNELFHTTLRDGLAIDEAISPAELALPEHQRLYQRVYDSLADGEQVSLVNWIGNFVAEGDHVLSQVLIAADESLDAAIRNQSPADAAGHEQTEASDLDIVQNILVESVETLLHHIREAQYQQTRQALMQHAGDAPAAEVNDQALLLQQLIEHRKANPSPGRIARL